MESRRQRPELSAKARSGRAGWEFALEINETAKEIAAQARVDAAFKKIPREVLEKKAVEQSDVHFFELGALSVDTKIKKRELALKLSDFVIPLDDVPAEVRSAIKHWDFRNIFMKLVRGGKSPRPPEIQRNVKSVGQECPTHTAWLRAGSTRAISSSFSEGFHRQDWSSTVFAQRALCFPLMKFAQYRKVQSLQA